MHVGIIPDGNRRWAKAKGFPLAEGHEAGFRALKNLLKECRNDGPTILSFYAFSTENFSRTENEVSNLFGLLNRVLESFTRELVKNKIRLLFTGARDNLDSSLLNKLDTCVQRCAETWDGIFTLNICFNYGAQQEITDAVKVLAQQCVDGLLRPQDITPEMVEKSFNTLPPVDLLIRTSGEQRISNFMLWQCAYSEFYFVPELWPDFTPQLFRNALNEFQSRQRRFGS